MKRSMLVALVLLCLAITFFFSACSAESSALSVGPQDDGVRCVHFQAALGNLLMEQGGVMNDRIVWGMRDAGFSDAQIEQATSAANQDEVKAIAQTVHALAIYDAAVNLYGAADCPIEGNSG